jgi:hypothetical protein
VFTRRSEIAFAGATALLWLAACEVVPDLRFVADVSEDAATDATVPDGPVEVDGGVGMDDADAAESSPDACPDATTPCVGIACMHCQECVNQMCPANQYCCAKVSGGRYQGVSCTMETRSCP